MLSIRSQPTVACAAAAVIEAATCEYLRNLEYKNAPRRWKVLQMDNFATTGFS